MVERAELERQESVWIGRVLATDDHAAFAELIRLHQAAVRHFLRRLTDGDVERADDLAQETFWRGYRHLATFAGRGRFLSWLFRIAFQLFINEERRRHGVRWVELSADTAAPGDAAQGIENSLTVERLLAALRPEERAALVLHYSDDLTHPEIAEVLGLPLGTVKSLLRRARLKLRAAPGRTFPGDAP